MLQVILLQKKSNFVLKEILVLLGAIKDTEQDTNQIN
jgi:hypothetical protein